MRVRVPALLFASLAGLVLVGCGSPECLVSDCTLIDSTVANVQLCGFPRDQIDRVEGRGFVHIGQQIPLQLVGDFDRVVSVAWRVDHQTFAPEPPRASLIPLSNRTAILTGLAPGGTHPADYLFVAADLVFRDGSEGVASAAYCGDGNWLPAHHVFVVP